MCGQYNQYLMSYILIKKEIGAMMMRMYGGMVKMMKMFYLFSGCGDEKRGMLLNFHDEVKKHTLMMCIVM